MRDHDEEPPLDPAQQRLRRKLVRLLFVSGGIMMLGLIAVFAAIVYKLAEGGNPTQAEVAGAASDMPHEARIAIPAGHRLVSADLNGDRALLSLEASDGSRLILLVDLASGRTITRYRLEAE